MSHPSPDPVEPTQRERILSAAREVFLEGPPENATMDAIAHAAGMSKKTIYREFKSQLELLNVLLAENVSDIGKFPEPRADADFEAELTRLLSSALAHATSARSLALVRLIISEIRRYPKLAQQVEDKKSMPVLISAWLSAPAVKERFDIKDPLADASMLLGMILQDAPMKFLLKGDARPLAPLLCARSRIDMATLAEFAGDEALLGLLTNLYNQGSIYFE